MGTDGSYGYAADGEGPAHEVVLSPFSIVALRGHQRTVRARSSRRPATAPRRSASAGRSSSAPFLPDDFPPTRAVAQTPWWRQVEGADWAHPEGPHSDVSGRADHPAIHISWNDAQAFCAWSATRLPTEAEWEFAARGGLVQRRFPWGDDLEPGGEHRMNVFQGTLPAARTASRTGSPAPRRSARSRPNGHGLYDMTGNVWEWTADWFDPRYYRHSPRENPRGPAGGAARVMRGRLLPLPRLLLQPLPRRRPQREHPGQLHGESGVPGGAGRQVAASPGAIRHPPPPATA